LQSIQIAREMSQQNWSILMAGWRDFPQLNALEKACFIPEDRWPFWDTLGVLTLPGLVRLKAVAGDCMVGFVGGERNHARHQGWVTTLGVLPDFRRRGIARALLSVCEVELAMPVIRLCVRESNEAAIRLYQSAGYQLESHWKKYYAHGETALVFEKSV